MDILCLKKEKESARSDWVSQVKLRVTDVFCLATLMAWVSFTLDCFYNWDFVCLELFLSGFSLFCSVLGKIFSGDEELGFIPMTQHYGES